MNKKKLLKKILSGTKNQRFADVVALAEAVGFTLTRAFGKSSLYKRSGAGPSPTR
jgi:hypothetical protein